MGQDGTKRCPPHSWSAPSDRSLIRSEGQEFDPVREILRGTTLGEHLQIGHALPDGNRQWVGVNNPREVAPEALAQGGLGEQVLVLTEKHPAQLGGTIQQFRVRQARRTIHLRRHHIDAPQHEGSRDRARDMDIHVQPDTHGSLPSSRNRFRIGESTSSARRILCSRSRAWIPASSSSRLSW